MSTNTAQLLAEIPLFSTMDDEERKQLRAIMKERSFQPGQVVMAASDPEVSFFIVEQGEMEVWLNDTDGKKVMLEVLGPGKVFGELFMHSGKTRSASATTSGELVTLELGQEAFFDFLRRRPDTAIDLLVELDQRLKDTDNILRTRVSRNANEDHEETLSPGQRVADLIANFSGSLAFLLLNLAVYFQQQWGAVAGTSVAAPIWAVGQALVNEDTIAHVGIVGYGPQLYYAVADEKAGGNAYFDVTSGDNLYYPATAGWDYATGLGTHTTSRTLTRPSS